MTSTFFVRIVNLAATSLQAAQSASKTICYKTAPADSVSTTWTLIRDAKNVQITCTQMFTAIARH